MASIFETTVVKLPSNVFDVPYYVANGNADNDEKKSIESFYLTSFYDSAEKFSKHIDGDHEFETAEEISEIAKNLFTFMIRDANTLLKGDVFKVEGERTKEYGVTDKWKRLDRYMTAVMGLLFSIRKLDNMVDDGELTTIKMVSSDYNAVINAEAELSGIVRRKKPDVQYATDSKEHEASLILPLARDVMAMMTVWYKPLMLLVVAMDKFNRKKGEDIFA